MNSEEITREEIDLYKHDIYAFGTETVWKRIERHSDAHRRIYWRRVYAIALAELQTEYEGWNFYHGRRREDDEDE